MDLPMLSVRAGIVLAVAGVAAVLILAALDDAAPPQPLLQTDGSLFVLASQPGVQNATWDGNPILVFVTTQERLDGVDAARGDGAATPSLPAGEGLRVFALSARSTHLGCTVGFKADLGASQDVADYDGDGVNDGRILDPCHHGQWDAFHRGEPMAGTPAPTRLAVLDLEWRDGELWAAGFDGPVGRQD